MPCHDPDTFVTANATEFPRVPQLDKEVESRLDHLAKKTGRTKTFYVREAILEHLEDLEDYYLAVDALQDTGRVYAADDAKR